MTASNYRENPMSKQGFVLTREYYLTTTRSRLTKKSTDASKTASLYPVALWGDDAAWKGRAGRVRDDKGGRGLLAGMTETSVPSTNTSLQQCTLRTESAVQTPRDPSSSEPAHEVRRGEEKHQVHKAQTQVNRLNKKRIQVEAQRSKVVKTPRSSGWRNAREWVRTLESQQDRRQGQDTGCP